jgi:hypothetical protein
MEPLNLAGIALIAVGILEAVFWRLAFPKNPRLARFQPILVGSGAASITAGVVFLLLN